MAILLCMTVFVACAVIAVVLYRKRRAYTEVQPQSPEPQLLSTYDTAGEIEVIEELDGSFHVCSSSGAAVTVNRAAATQIHRWCAPYECHCSCIQEEAPVVSFQVFNV